MNSNHPILVRPPQILSNQVTLKNNFDMERSDFTETEIVLVQQGHVHVWFDGISYSLGGGDIVLVPCLPYRLSSAGDDPCTLVTPYLSSFQYAGQQEGRLPFATHETILQYSNSTVPMIKIITQIHAELSEKRPDFKVASSKLTEYLLILLRRKLMDNDLSAEPASLLSGIKEYIENNYEKNITLSSLSDTFFVSPFHIAHLFKEKFDISPIQYLIKTRIKIASELLIQTGYTVFEISNLVGYPNANYFNIIFKRFTGMSPGKYRKKMQKR